MYASNAAGGYFYISVPLIKVRCYEKINDACFGCCGVMRLFGA